MARRIEKTSGKVGSVVFFNLGDKNHTRSVPRNLKQTKATKKAASIFGQASTIGAAIRPKLLEGLSLEPINDIQTRLVSAIAEWLRVKEKNQLHVKETVLPLSNFQFNKVGGELNSKWKLPWNIHIPEESSLQIGIPSFVPTVSVAAPAGTVSVDCLISAASCGVNSKTFCGSAKTSFSFDQNQKEIPAHSILL